MKPIKLFQGFGHEAPKAPVDTRPTKPSTECMANGCPLPGVYRVSNEASLCCVHDDEDAHRWPLQTERILDQLTLWTVALGMSNADAKEPIKERTIAGVVEEGGPNADGITTQRGYSAAIRSFLIRECKGKPEAPPAHGAFRGLVKRLTSTAEVE